jgi:hypothetical protein
MSWIFLDRTALAAAPLAGRAARKRATAIAVPAFSMPPPRQDYAEVLARPLIYNPRCARAIGSSAGDF